jgi:hypothetical protein
MTYRDLAVFLLFGVPASLICYAICFSIAVWIIKGALT